MKCSCCGSALTPDEAASALLCLDKPLCFGCLDSSTALENEYTAAEKVIGTAIVAALIIGFGLAVWRSLL